MSSFRNRGTGVQVSVADHKDDRFLGGDWEPVVDEPAAAETKKTKKVKETDK